MAAAPVGAAVLVAAPAEAQVAVEWQGSVSAGLGVTTNVANSAIPDRRAPKGTVAPEWDGFGSITPALQLVLETQRTTNTFVYGLDYRFYFRHHEANAISNSLSYTLAATLSKTTELTLGLNGSQTQLSAFNIVGSGQTAQAIPTTSGNNYLFTGVATESLNVATSELDSFSEGASFSANDNLPPKSTTPGTSTPPSTQTYLASATLNYAHTFRNDSLGVSIGSDVGVFPDLPGGGAIIPQHTDIIHRADLNWHHDFSDEWSTNAAAGALVAYQAADLHLVAEPAGSASVDYVSGRGTAGLTYAHSAQPNLLLGQMMFGDSAAVRGSVPLGRTPLDLSGAGAFLASRALLSDAQRAEAHSGAFGPVTYSITVDAALGYQRDPLPLRFEIRYQLARQFGAKPPPCSATEPPPCSKPVPGEIAVAEIRRQNLGVFATYFFPHAPPPGTRGPSVVPLPPPTSNPGEMNRATPTRGQLVDSDKQGAQDRKKKNDKATGAGGEAAPSESK